MQGVSTAPIYLRRDIGIFTYNIKINTQIDLTFNIQVKQEYIKDYFGQTNVKSIKE